jgi:hypothetical protein
MFNKETYDEIKIKVREINKLKKQADRLETFINYKNSLHLRINDELDEIFSSINLRKSKEED